MGVRLGPPREEAVGVEAPEPAPGRRAQDWLSTLAVTAAVVLIQWARIRDTFFAIDDFIFLGIARAQPYGLTLLRKPLFEHFSPALWTENYVEVRLLRAQHGVALAIGLTITAIGVALLHRLVLRISGSNLAAVALSGLYGTSMFLTSILRWWTTSAHANLAATFSIACLLAFCRFEDGRRVRDAVASLVLLVGALLTHEKALLVPLYLGLLWLLLYQRTFALGDVWAALRKELWLWVGYGLVWAASLANFLAYYYQPRTGPALKALGAFALRSVFTTFLPASYGIRLPQVGGSVGGAVETLAVVGLVVAVVLTWRAAAASGRGWLFLLIAFGANLWVLGTARLPVFQVGVYRSLQWQLELAFLFPIGLAIVVREVRARSQARAAGGRHGAAAALVIALAIPYAWFSVRSNPEVRAEFNGGDFSRPFLTALTRGLEAAGAAGADPALLDRPLPGTFAPDWMFPYNMLSEFVPTFRLHAEVGAHVAGGPVYAVGDDGTLQRYDLAPPLQPPALLVLGQRVAGAPSCANVDSRSGAVFRAATPSPASLGPGPVLRVDYRAETPTTIDVVGTGDDDRPRELSYRQVTGPATSDEYDLLLRGPLTGDHVDVVLTSSQAETVCVKGVTLGKPVPAGS